jgi:putative hydrolase
MAARINEQIAGRLEEVARVLRDQGADPFRCRAYLHAATELRRLDRPVDAIWRERGLEGLLELPGVGQTIARSIRDLLTHGRLAMLDRLRGVADPVTILSSVPGIGGVLAHRLHEDMGIDTLEQLEAAAHDGRLEQIAGFGEKRLAGIRDSLAHRLGRVRIPPPGGAPVPVAELLDVDREYRDKATAGTLPKIAPRRFNPKREAWLPILHTKRGSRHYTALFSNTPRAHRLGTTRDWVVLYLDDGAGERQHTVLTAARGPLAGKRVVAGHEDECARYYGLAHGTRAAG